MPRFKESVESSIPWECAAGPRRLPNEQLRRFKDREITPYKQYKLTEEDWRNRAKSGAYEAAACEMIERTSTNLAPWVLVEANDKYWARIKVLKAVCNQLERALDTKE